MAEKAKNKNPVKAENNGSAVGFLNTEVSAGANIALWLVAVVLLIVAIFGNYYVSKEYSELFNDSINSLIKGCCVVLVVLLAVIVALFTNKGRQALSFAKESYTEVRRVVWPDFQKTKQVTIMVGVIACLVAALLWIFDVIVMFVLKQIDSI